MRFEGKVGVVLGGNSGIGLAIARQLKAEGARVAITGRDPVTLEKAGADLGALAIRSDIADIAASRATCARIEAELGRIDALFINAAIGGFVSIDQLTEELWDRVHGVNLKGCVFAAKAALPHMRDGGAIVFTGSVGAVVPMAGSLSYSSAKGGLRSAVRIFAVELLGRGIRVNMVSPGATETEIFKRDATADQIASQRAAMAGRVPMGRLADPEETARAALFLGSSDSSYINGVDLYVDGGRVELYGGNVDIYGGRRAD